MKIYNQIHFCTRPPNKARPMHLQLRLPCSVNAVLDYAMQIMQSCLLSKDHGALSCHISKSVQNNTICSFVITTYKRETMTLLQNYGQVTELICSHYFELNTLFYFPFILKIKCGPLTEFETCTTYNNTQRFLAVKCSVFSK